MALLALLVAGDARADDALAEKAARFRQALVEHHVSREGVLLYRMDAERGAQDLERGTYPPSADLPTYTGLWAATACLRARVDSEPAQALADAERALAGLELLMRVTGVRGLLARSVRRDAGVATDGFSGRWFRGATGFENWSWRGDASHDQYANGLLPAVAACAQAFPERARGLVTDFAAHLLDHDLQLIDPDGRRTRFGDLSPRSGLGFNSIAQITAYAAFALAAELDPDPRWARQRDRLRDGDRVLARGRRTNLRVLGITNHSNDLMAWNLYRVLVPLARATGDPGLADLRHGMQRAWLRVRPDGNAYFALALCAIEPPSCDRSAAADARQLLERFPEDKRQRSAYPGLDALPRWPIPGRKAARLARAAVPIELRPPSSFEWKSSPYRLEGGTDPSIQYTGLDFLAAYWLWVAHASGRPLAP